MDLSQCYFDKNTNRYIATFVGKDNSMFLSIQSAAFQKSKLFKDQHVVFSLASYAGQKLEHDRKTSEITFTFLNEVIIVDGYDARDFDQPPFRLQSIDIKKLDFEEAIDFIARRKILVRDNLPQIILSLKAQGIPGTAVFTDAQLIESTFDKIYNRLKTHADYDCALTLTVDNVPITLLGRTRMAIKDVANLVRDRFVKG